jgi:hypothetical protein
VATGIGLQAVGEQNRGTRARGRRREGGDRGGPIWKSQKLQGPLGKLKFPTYIKI